MGSIAELPSGLSHALVLLFILVCVACRQLKSPSLVSLGAVLQFRGVSAPGFWFQFWPLVPVINNCN